MVLIPLGFSANRLSASILPLQLPGELLSHVHFDASVRTSWGISTVSISVLSSRLFGEDEMVSVSMLLFGLWCLLDLFFLISASLPGRLT